MQKNTKLAPMLKEILNTEAGKPTSGNQMRKSNDPTMKFLQRFNYQPFDDWYQNYNRFIEGDEFGTGEMEDFIYETKNIIEFLKKVTI